MTKELYYIISAFSFGLGAIIASFLNVVIWRVPRGESIVLPPSHCPKCGAHIKWYQNIPIISWILLRAHCANCKEPISPRYVLIETLGAILFFFAWARFGFFAPIFWIWFAFMIVGTFIDFDHQLLPDFVTVGGMILGLLLIPIEFFILHSSFFISAAEHFGGLALGFGLFMLIRLLGGKVFKREAMGMGDVLLMGAVGAITGPVSVLFVLIVSSLVGAISGLIFRKRVIPFGPFICLAHLVYLFFGQEIIWWYLNLLHTGSVPA